MNCIMNYYKLNHESYELYYKLNHEIIINYIIKNIIKHKL